MNDNFRGRVKKDNHFLIIISVSSSQFCSLTCNSVSYEFEQFTQMYNLIQEKWINAVENKFGNYT